ncbi:MAG TPA: amidohydrolase family protein [Amycolatopsis sp.]|nr:amidohydrolase family protein [Amycolatopsis sp.]
MLEHNPAGRLATPGARRAPNAPRRAVVDAHHHLWAASGAPVGHEGSSYGARELLDDARERELVASVVVECGAMYRADGPDPLKQVGETAFAARAGSGERLCAGIVASADLADAENLGEVLDAHAVAASGRLRGVRHTGAWDASPGIPNGRVNPPEGLYRSDEFARGFAQLSRRGLSFDAWVYHPQLPDVAALAARFPDTLIIVNHCGGPLGAGPYAGRPEAFTQWRTGIAQLARQPNARVKLGGLGMRIGPLHARPFFTGAEELARAIRPYIEGCIEAFGADRAMFESNFPMDRGSYSYTTIWDAFEVLSRDASEAERERLFGGTATEAYRLEASEGR